MSSQPRLAESYLTLCVDLLQRIQDEQMDKIIAAAGLISDAIAEGHSFFAFGCTHSNLPVQDVFYRAGGLMLVNPIIPPGLTLDVRPPTMTSQMEQMSGYGKVIFQNVPAGEGDVLVLLSTSGRNPVPVEVALEAKARSMKVIVITSLAYTQAVEPRHSSGKKVYELADIVFDNYSPKGDAVLSVDGCEQKTGSASTVIGAVLMQAIVSQVVQNLVEKGITPPIYVSGNLDGGMAQNARMLEAYKDRIFYM